MRKQSIEKAATLLLEHGYTQIETELKLPLYQPFDLSIGKICHPTAKPPLITTEILRKLPKTDLNCRFEGSISVEKLWEFYQKDPSQISIKFDVPMVSKDEFDSIFSPPAQWNLEWEKKPKVVMKELTKLRENITSGLEDIVAQAAKDNVKCKKFLGIFIHTN